MPFDEPPPMVGPTLLEEGRGLGLCAVAAGPISSLQGGSFSANTGQDALGMDSTPDETGCEYVQLVSARLGHPLISPRREQRSLWQTTRLLKHRPNPRPSLVLNPRLETKIYILTPLSKNAPRRRPRRGIFRSRRRRSRACPGRRPPLLAFAATQSGPNPLSASGSCTAYPKRPIAEQRTDRIRRRRDRQSARLLLRLPGSVIPPLLFPTSRTVRRRISSRRSLPRQVAVPSVKRPGRQPVLARVARRA